MFDTATGKLPGIFGNVPVIPNITQTFANLNSKTIVEVFQVRMAEPSTSTQQTNGLSDDPLSNINIVLIIALMLTTIAGNLLVLSTVWKTPSLRNSSTTLLCGLAVSDLAVGLVVQPLYIAIREAEENRMLHAINSLMGYSLCGTSLCTITAVNVDRFLALYFHLRYPVLVTPPRCIYTLVAIWIVNFSFSLSSLWNLQVQTVVLMIGMGSCLLTSSLVYIYIYRTVRHHRVNIQVLQNTAHSSAERRQLHMATYKKTAVSSFIVFCCLLLCYIPYFVRVAVDGNNSAWYLANTAVFMNSSLNPFLYCWRLRELRTAASKLCRKMLRKENRGD